MKTNSEFEEYLSEVDLNKFNNSYEEACLFYFGMLKKLNLKVITTEIQIDHMAITYEKNKKEIKPTATLKKEESIGDLEKVQNVSGTFDCKVKGCNKGFDKKSALDLHEVLRHKMQPNEWANNKIFHIEIKEGNDQSRRGSRNS